MSCIRFILCTGWGLLRYVVSEKRADTAAKTRPFSWGLGMPKNGPIVFVFQIQSFRQYDHQNRKGDFPGKPTGWDSQLSPTCRPWICQGGTWIQLWGVLVYQYEYPSLSSRCIQQKWSNRDPSQLLTDRYLKVYHVFRKDGTTASDPLKAVPSIGSGSWVPKVFEH